MGLEMKHDPRYRADLAAQVNGMIAAAGRRHPSFEDDCLTSPQQLVAHWADDVSIEFVDGLLPAAGEWNPTVEDPDTRDSDAAEADRSGITETFFSGGHSGASETSGLSGLFTPPIGAQPARVRIYNAARSFSARNNFTLLHEIGHLLQQTEDELAFRLIRISGLACDRRFEEDACNAFAARALLPDRYLQWFFSNGVTAEAVAEIYDDVRSYRGMYRPARVSRQVIARRVAQILGGEATVTVVDDKGMLRVRAHGDGHCDYPTGNQHGDATGNQAGNNQNVDRADVASGGSSRSRTDDRTDDRPDHRTGERNDDQHMPGALTPVESDVLHRLRNADAGIDAGQEDAGSGRSPSQTFGLSLPDDGEGPTATGAFSYSGRNRPFAFIVVP